MKHSASRQLPEESVGQVTTDGTQPQPASAEKAGAVLSVTALDRGAHEKERPAVYTPGSPLSHLMYGLGTLAFLVVPPLVPVFTGRGLIMGYMIVLVTVYTVVCLWGIGRALHFTGTQKKIRRTRRYT